MASGKAPRFSIAPIVSLVMKRPAPRNDKSARNKPFRQHTHTHAPLATVRHAAARADEAAAAGQGEWGMLRAAMAAVPWERVGLVPAEA
jgi:hypothetical protein